MNARISFVVASIVFGVFAAGCNSDPAKEDATVKKAFMGGPMPKGFMDKMAASKSAGMKAGQEAAAKAAAANAGK